jgi:5-methyltetrahydrofolate--homocysteine methyltransferase
MVHVAKEMKRQEFNLPLLIGGATTSVMHTAVKIDPQYEHPVVYVKDASRAVGVAQNLIGSNKTDFATQIKQDYVKKREQHQLRRSKKPMKSIKAARENAHSIDWSDYTPPKPSFIGTKVFNDFPLDKLVERIDWTPFFQTWELAGKFPKILDDEVVGTHAKQLYSDAKAMLESIVAEKWITANGIIGFYPANSQGDDILVYQDETRSQVVERLCHLREQKDKANSNPNYCLSDYIAPEQSGLTDYVGGFAVGAGFGIETRIAQYDADHDDYNSIMLKALADRLAEAFAEKLHELVRQELWGYASSEAWSNDELIAEKYQGIRPAPGYPACPDHTEKAKLWQLLQVEKLTGIQLTDSYAMYPAAAVSGWYFSHPESRYFGLGTINKDQVEDYAKRKNMTLAQAEKWLAPNLGYEPVDE